MWHDQSQECGSTALLYVFFGVTASIFGFAPFYAILFLLVFAFVWLFEAFGPPFIELVAHYTLGILVGVMFSLALPMSAWLPKRIFANFTSTMILLVELGVLALTFVVADIRIPETNWPAGFLVSFVAFVGIFILIYIVNYSYFEMAERDFPGIVYYNCTYIYWLSAMVPFFLAFGVCSFHPVVSSLLGAALNVPVILYLKYVSTLGQSSRPWNNF